MAGKVMGSAADDCVCDVATAANAAAAEESDKNSKSCK